MSGWLDGWYAYLTGAPPTPEDGGKEVGAAHGSVPPTVWPVSAQVAAELKKGICYNMKVVIRGAPRTGKSTLLSRLCGHDVQQTYSPSRGIAASTMRYRGKGCRESEGTKVDIWDVADDCAPLRVALPPPPPSSSSSMSSPAAWLSGSARLTGLPSSPSSTAAPPETCAIDVYKDCQLVILVVNASDRASWSYAQSEAARVPLTACVLFVLNLFDDAETGAPRAVSEREVAAFCASLPPMRSLFFIKALEGRAPSSVHCVHARCVSANCLTGRGVDNVAAYLEIPNTMLRIAVMETRLQYLYESLSGFSLEGHRAPDTTPPPAQQQEQGTSKTAQPQCTTTPTPTAGTSAKEAAKALLFSHTTPAATALSSSSPKPIGGKEKEDNRTRDNHKPARRGGGSIEDDFYRDISNSNSTRTTSSSSSSSSEEEEEEEKAAVNVHRSTRKNAGRGAQPQASKPLAPSQKRPEPGRASEVRQTVAEPAPAAALADPEPVAAELPKPVGSAAQKVVDVSTVVQDGTVLAEDFFTTRAAGEEEQQEEDEAAKASSTSTSSTNSSPTGEKSQRSAGNPPRRSTAASRRRGVATSKNKVSGSAAAAAVDVAGLLATMQSTLAAVPTREGVSE